MERNATLKPPFCLILLFVFVAVRATTAQDTEVIPDDQCIVELNLPDDATVAVDGRGHGLQRRLAYRQLEPGRWVRSKLRIDFPSGKHEERDLLVRGGEHIRIALRDPSAQKPELVMQTGLNGGGGIGLVSPDGQHVFASGMFDPDRAVLWGAISGRRLRTFRADPPLMAIPLAISPDGTKVYTADRTREGPSPLGGSTEKISVWDRSTGEKLQTILRPAGADFGGIAPSHDGARIAVEIDEVVTVWDTSSGRKVASLKRYAGRIVCLAVSLGGDQVVAGFSDGNTVLWDVASGRDIGTYSTNAGPIASVAFVAGRVYAVTGKDPITLWDLRAQRRVGEFQGEMCGHLHRVLSPDGAEILTVRDGQVVVWEIETEKQVRTLQLDDEFTSLAVFCCGGRQIAATLTGVDPGIVFWDARTGEPLRSTSWETDETVLHSLSIGGAGQHVMIGSGWDATVLWNTTKSTFNRRTNGPPGLARQFSPDDQKILICGPHDNTTYLTDVISGSKVTTFKHANWVLDAAFSPAGDCILTVSGGEAVLWKIEPNRRVRAFRPNKFGALCATFKPGGRHVLLGGCDLAIVTSDNQDRIEESGKLVVCDRANGREVRSYSGKWGPVTGVAYTRDGRYILIGMGILNDEWTDPKVILLDAESGEEVRVFSGFCAGEVFPDGRHVLSLQFGPYGGNTLTLHDIAAGSEVAKVVLLNGGEDWLVATPEGLFDSSTGARHKATFRIGGGLDVVPLDSFFQDFYRSGLLTQILRGERPLPDIDIGKSLPPTLKIVSPESGAADERSVRIEVEAIDQGGGVANLAIYHNGARVLAPGKMRRVGDVVRRTFELSLVEGTNQLRATAASADGSWESEPAEVLLTYEKPLPTQLHVLVVGINRYADANLNLRFATNDARTFADLFRRRGDDLYAQVHVTELFDHEATREGIVESLKQMAARTLPEDTLVAFLSGHGRMVGQRYYFVPYELRKQGALLDDDLRKHGLPADEISDYLGSANAVKRILILDTCASGGALGPAVRPRSGFALRGAVERLSRTHGIYTIAAAAATEEAQEPAELGHGVLSYALLAGLKAVDRGPLDGVYVQPSSPERVVDVMEWITYAAGHVPRLTEQLYGTSQDVQYSIQGQSFPILPLDD